MSANSAELEAARVLLAKLGVSPADLLTSARNRVEVPTFAEYIPVVRADSDGVWMRSTRCRSARAGRGSVGLPRRSTARPPPPPRPSPKSPANTMNPQNAPELLIKVVSKRLACGRGLGRGCGCIVYCWGG